MLNCSGPHSKPRHQRGLGDHTDLSGAHLRRRSAASLRGWVFPRLFSSAYFPTIPPIRPLAPREHRHKIGPDVSARLCVRSPGACSRGRHRLPGGQITDLCPASVLVLELVLIGSLANKTVVLVLRRAPVHHRGAVHWCCVVTFPPPSLLREKLIKIWNFYRLMRPDVGSCCFLFLSSHTWTSGTYSFLLHLLSGTLETFV